MNEALTALAALIVAIGGLLGPYFAFRSKQVGDRVEREVTSTNGHPTGEHVVRASEGITHVLEAVETVVELLAGLDTRVTRLEAQTGTEGPLEASSEQVGPTPPV